MSEVYDAPQCLVAPCLLALQQQGAGLASDARASGRMVHTLRACELPWASGLLADAMAEHATTFLLSPWGLLMLDAGLRHSARLCAAVRDAVLVNSRSILLEVRGELVYAIGYVCLQLCHLWPELEGLSLIMRLFTLRLTTAAHAHAQNAAACGLQASAVDVGSSRRRARASVSPGDASGA